MTTDLALDDITIAYGKAVIAEHLSLHCRGGRVTALLGHNGAGKTSILRILAGARSPRQGRATVASRLATEVDDADIGFMTETLSLDGLLRVSDYFNVLSRLVVERDALRESAQLWGIDRTDRRPVKTLSTGQHKRLQLAIAFAHAPGVCLLDEPFSGLDPESSAIMGSVVRSWADEGRTVVLASHDLAEVAAVVDDLIVIKEGRVLASGTLDEMQGRFASHPRVMLRDGRWLPAQDEHDLQRVIADAVRRSEEIVEIDRGIPGLEEIYRRLHS